MKNYNRKLRNRQLRMVVMYSIAIIISALSIFSIEGNAEIMTIDNTLDTKGITRNIDISMSYIPKMESISTPMMVDNSMMDIGANKNTFRYLNYFVSKYYDLENERTLILDAEELVATDIVNLEKYTYSQGEEVSIIGEYNDLLLTRKGAIKRDSVSLLCTVEAYEAKLEAERTEAERIEAEMRDVIYSDDVRVKSGATVSKLERLVEGTGLEGIGSALYEIEQTYGINALFAYAVAALESGYGSSNIAKDKNNLYGMNAVDSSPYQSAFHYSSKGESVIDFAERIMKYYVDKGRHSIYVINHIYSSDTEWDSKVMSIMQRAADELNSNKEIN